MEDEFMNDCLVTYIEQDIFNEIKNKDVLQYSKKNEISWNVL